MSSPADIDNTTYAPINRTLSYNKIDRTELPNDPYAVSDDHYTKLALRQWGMEPTQVASEYFSITNIKRVQKKIKREIYNRSYGKFRLSEDQNVLDLLQCMIIIYMEYAKNLPSRVISQVKHLNDLTVQYIAPDMMTNLKQYYGYLSDIKNPVNPMPQPLNVNHAGRLQLKGVAQVYGL